MSYKFNPFSGNFDIVGSASGGTGDPGGSTTQVQFNDGGVFGGDSTFTFNKTTDTLTVANLGTTGNVTLGDASGDTVAIRAGTAALPTLIPNGDPNTGLWFPAADTVAWSTAGSERLRIDSAGNVGIGTNAPNSSLQTVVPIATAYATTLSSGGSGHLPLGIFDIASIYNSGSSINNGFASLHFTSVGSSGTATGRLILGNSLGGTGFFAMQMRVGAATETIERFRISSTEMLLRQSSNPANTSVSFNTTTQNALTLDASGNFGIGATSFGTSAATVLGIKTGTAPTTGPADTIQLYSTDLSAGNTMLSLFTEGTCVNANTTAAATHRIAVRINGTVYYLLANTAA